MDTEAGQALLVARKIFGPAVDIREGQAYDEHGSHGRIFRIYTEPHAFIIAVWREVSESMPAPVGSRVVNLWPSMKHSFHGKWNLSIAVRVVSSDLRGSSRPS